jgi:hypothetical protein
MPSDVPSLLHHLAVGQVAEWGVWSRLVATSGGDLHVFLPLDDRGIDGIVHRISTDAYARIQVKGRSVHRYPGVELKVPVDELVDDRATLIAVSLDLPDSTIGGRALVIGVPMFRQLATRYEHRGTVSYRVELDLSAPPPEWDAWCVSLDEMGERLLPPAAAPAIPVALPADWVAARRLGYRAEMELLRRAADCASLNVFKAHPDLEPNEYLLYETVSREILGVQVKSVSFTPGSNEAHCSVYRPALRPSPHTWFVIFLADDSATEFLPDCAVIPSLEIPAYLGGNETDGGIAITRHLTGRLERWRVPVAGLGARLAELAALPASTTALW